MRGQDRVGKGVGVAEGLGVRVGLGLKLGLRVGVAERVGLNVGEGLRLGVGVGVKVGVPGAATRTTKRLALMAGSRTVKLAAPKAGEAAGVMALEAPVKRHHCTD
jgi:hypothetical protein